MFYDHTWSISEYKANIAEDCEILICRTMWLVILFPSDQWETSAFTIGFYDRPLNLMAWKIERNTVNIKSFTFDFTVNIRWHGWNSQL